MRVQDLFKLILAVSTSQDFNNTEITLVSIVISLKQTQIQDTNNRLWNGSNEEADNQIQTVEIA